MRVILRENVGNLGNRGDIKEVKKGYAINYLFPKNLAYPATDNNLKTLEIEKKRLEKKEEKLKQEMEQLKEKIETASCNITAKVGEDDKLFGAVTSQDIIDKLKTLGINIDKKQLEIEEPIKKLGVYHLTVKVHPDIKADLKVWVIKE